MLLWYKQLHSHIRSQEMCNNHRNILFLKKKNLLSAVVQQRICTVVILGTMLYTTLGNYGRPIHSYASLLNQKTCVSVVYVRARRQQSAALLLNSAINLHYGGKLIKPPLTCSSYWPLVTKWWSLQQCEMKCKMCYPVSRSNGGMEGVALVWKAERALERVISCTATTAWTHGPEKAQRKLRNV